MSDKDQDHETEDEMQRKKLGPRGLPGGAEPPEMTPKQKKNNSTNDDFDGHPA